MTQTVKQISLHRENAKTENQSAGLIYLITVYELVKYTNVAVLCQHDAYVPFLSKLSLSLFLALRCYFTYTFGAVQCFSYFCYNRRRCDVATLTRYPTRHRFHAYHVVAICSPLTILLLPAPLSPPPLHTPSTKYPTHHATKNGTAQKKNCSRQETNSKSW